MSMEKPDLSNTVGMLLDGVLASEAIDSTAESLSIEGMDISDLEQGKGFVDYEHLTPEDTQKDNVLAQELVGKIVFVKKIYGPEDCDDERQKFFWKETKLPFLYGICRLYDQAGSEPAKALAASIRDSAANNEPLFIKFSIEGSTLERKGQKLVSTIAKGVALCKRPANHQAISGLMADPGAPEGFDKGPAKILKHEGGYATDLNKTLTAGSYNVAPGSLVGGAALQREDRTLRAVAQAARRDWNKKGKFRDFLVDRIKKADLPEVSDDFIDHYSDLVEGHHWRVRKAEEVVADLKKAGKSVAKIKPVVDTGYTNNGVPIKPNKNLAKPEFDEKKGVLHIPEGSFKVYMPSQDKDKSIHQKYQQILNDPKIEKFHNYVMQNWLRAHKLFKAGKTPPELAAHAVIFSGLSPNKSPPSQELQYGHLIDSLKENKVGPLEAGGLKEDWLSRDNPNEFPAHSPSHWKRLEDQLRLKNDSIKGTRKQGDIQSFQLPHMSFDNTISKLPEWHKGLMESIQRTRSGRASTEELLNHKVNYNNWRNGKQAQPFNGVKVAGLAPKTMRYAMGMLGAGDVAVPDTHFVRNLFGLRQGVDSKSIDAIKNALWNDRNAHLLNGIDRYYAQNHDAVQHLLNHPKWGSHFQNPEDAIFPSFWKHWMTILPQEAIRGHNSFGGTELTDHKPFWDAVGPYMKKSENIGNLPLQTAQQHEEWRQQYGEMPAMMLYYRHIVPQLLEAAAKREMGNLVQKTEKLVKMAVGPIKAGSQVKPEPMGIRGTVSYIHPMEGTKSWDYSHHLDPEHLKAGYRLHVWASPIKSLMTGQDLSLKTILSHGQKFIGGAEGIIHNYSPEVLKNTYSHIDDAHRGRGLGTKAYEALYAHAVNHHGVTGVAGDEHSTAAGGVHNSLAREHGFKYRQTPNPQSKGPIKDFDGKNNRYNYLIKNDGEDLPHPNPLVQPHHEDSAINFQGKNVVPGHLKTDNGDFHLLASNDDHFVGYPAQMKDSTGYEYDTHLGGPEFQHEVGGKWYTGIDHTKLVEIPKNSIENHNFLHHPMVIQNNATVDANVHGIPQFVSHPESKKLAHGFDFTQKKTRDRRGSAWSDTSYWAKTADGRDVFVKNDSFPGEFGDNTGMKGMQAGQFNSARREGVMFNMAHNFFGLGEHMPNVAVVKHPMTGQDHALIERIPGLQTGQDYAKIGGPETQKLALMNIIMHNSDRHGGNWGRDENGKIKLFDHNLIGTVGRSHWVPDYLDKKSAEPLSEDTEKWLDSLDPVELGNQLRYNGAPNSFIEAAQRRLKFFQAQPSNHNKFIDIVRHAMGDHERRQDEEKLAKERREQAARIYDTE